jgi:hypothetical protein
MDFGGARHRRTESEDAVAPDLLTAEKGKENTKFSSRLQRSVKRVDVKDFS